MILILSKLPKTWLIDLDGTIVKHNGYLEGEDSLLPGVREFFEKIPKEDRVIILTSRSEKYKTQTEDFLRRNDIRYDLIIFDLPVGERILINDEKPSGLKTAHAVNIKRDNGLSNLNFEMSDEL